MTDAATPTPAAVMYQALTRAVVNAIDVRLAVNHGQSLLQAKHVRAAAGDDERAREVTAATRPRVVVGLRPLRPLSHLSRRFSRIVGERIGT